jgi:hypothetical protein
VDLGDRLHFLTNTTLTKQGAQCMKLNTVERCWERSYVASMSRGAAGNLWEALKTNGNFCNMTQHEIDGNAS